MNTIGKHSLGLAAAAMALALAVTLVAEVADATPIYAIRSANACDTCHIEPGGWAQPELADRMCTLDCRGCHVSPAGGGLRTPTGLFYGREVLPTFGTRPSASANPDKYRPKNHPKKGRSRLFEDFEGWWPGSIDMDDIPDRFGDINPEPTVRAGFDIRNMIYLPVKGEDDAAIFPMQADFYLAYKPTEQLTTYVNAGLAGRRREDNVLKGDDVVDERETIDYITIRELFVMYDELPYNSYVRAGRFIPPFGWRVPDHTSFVRRDTQNAQYRSVFGVEGGWNPNYPYVNAALFYQGLEAWPGDQNDEGLGAAITGGVRELNYQYGGSVQYLKRSDEALPDDLVTGVNWGVVYYPVVYMGELNYKLSSPKGDGDAANGLIALHEVNALITQGVSALLKYDWSDLNTNTLDDHNHRVTVGAQWNAYTHLQFDLQYRRNWTGNNPLLNFGDTSAEEVLFITHGWF